MIQKPTLLLNKTTCLQNIRTMTEKARNNDVIFRPHFKTHQSLEIGRWFRHEGVEKITVSSLSMAEYFARDGWKDITVAFPVNVLEMDTINQLARKLSLNLLIESSDVVELLDQYLSYPVQAFVKIDLGAHRTGIAAENFSALTSIMEAMNQSKMITPAGFLSHAGQSYSARGREQITEVHQESVRKMQALKNRYSSQYPDLITSLGDTPTCSVIDNFSGIDEIRPGNFVFYDLTQLQIKSCNSGQIAVAMACPVVAKHPERHEMVIYGGAIHFSKDQLQDPQLGTIYGKAVENKENGWGNIIDEVYLKRLSQEHGIVAAPREFLNRYKEGDILKILPVHSCLTANLVPGYLTTEEEEILNMREQLSG